MFFIALTLALNSSEDNVMDARRLNELIERYGHQILRTAYMYLKDRQKAEDVSQEVFIKLYRNNPIFTSPDHEKAWLLRVTINLCKDQLKSFWSKRIVLDDTKEGASMRDTSDIALDNEQARQLFHAVLSLPENFKTPIILYYYHGMTSAQIAKIISTPEATVRSRLKRGREKLKTKLSNLWKDA